MTVVKQHYKEIDVFKGLAILLIIISHCFCSFPVDFRETSLISVQHLIGTFNLNMFFLGSGILFSVNGTWGDFFKKKVSRLMLPWFTFTVIALLVKKIMAAYVKHPAGSFGHELFMDIVYGRSYWFLYALFLMMIVTKLIKNRRLLALMGGALLISLPLIKFIPDEFSILCAKRFIYYYPWFIMGVLIKERYANISQITQANYMKSLLCALLILVVLILLVMTGISRQYVLQNYLMPVLGCVSFYLFSCSISSLVKNEKIVTYFGIYSLQYYLNHLLIMLACYYVGALIFAISQFAALIVIFFLAVLISTIMLWVERKMPKPIRSLFGFV